MTPSDFPRDMDNTAELMKIMEYNNQHHGIIDKQFVEWALHNKISYDAIMWFVRDFSRQRNQNLLWDINALFCPYTIYCDESGNCTKFRLKDESGQLNTDWRNDFVLAGVAFEGTTPPFDIDELFASLKLQKSVTDAKLKNIAEYNGDDVNRFIDILKSQKLHTVLSTLANHNVYLHWSTMSLLYYALVDIVDSVLEIPSWEVYVKTVLYHYVQMDLDFFLSFLAQYNYPNLAKEDIHDFCDRLIEWIDTRPHTTTEENFGLELLRQGLKEAQKKNELIFITDNVDKLLIDNFVPLYALKISNFPNSVIHFDHCGIVEENISRFASLYPRAAETQYDFLISGENKWIQLSDFISGLFAALRAFLNANDKTHMKTSFDAFEHIQKENLRILMQLMDRSREHNIYFDHMINNLEQIEKYRYLYDLAI